MLVVLWVNFLYFVIAFAASVETFENDVIIIILKMETNIDNSESVIMFETSEIDPVIGEHQP